MTVHADTHPIPLAGQPGADSFLDTSALLALLENSGDGFALIDATDDVYLYVNSAACSALGATANGLIGTRSPWPVPDHGSGELATQLAGRDYTYRVTLLHTAGRPLHAIQFRDVTADRRREAQLRAFSLSASNIAYADSLSNALDRLADQVRRTAVDMASCTFLLYDTDGRVRQSGASGRYPHTRDYLQRLIQSRELGAPLLSDEVMRTGRPEIAAGWHDRMLTDPRFAPMRGFTQKSDWDTIVVVPLLSRGEPIGVFNGFYREGTNPSDDDVQFLLSIADQAAIAVDMFSLRDRAQREAARDERNKLARDLHDSVSQMLFTLNLQAAAAARIAAGHDVEQPLHEIRSLSDEAFTAMRQLILGTRPGDADSSVNLTAALRRHVDALREHSTINVDIEAPGDGLLLPPDTQEHLFRVVQESLHNAVRHAPGAHVRIRLQPDPSHARLRMEVSDDGPGFDSDTSRPGHLGLANMAERIEQIGGKLTVQSGPSGTTIRATVPFQRGKTLIADESSAEL